MKLHVAVYFTKHLQVKPKIRSTDNRKVKPTMYGEVLTTDQVIDRLEEKEREKMRKEKEKAEKAAKQAATKKAVKKTSKKKQTEEEEIGMLK